MVKTYERWNGSEIKENTEYIKIQGHIGRWYVIDITKRNGQTLFLLEHETYGDDVANLIVTKTGHVKLDDVWNGFEELEY